MLSKLTFSDDIKSIFTEINLRKTKRLMFGAQHPPIQPNDYFFESIGRALDQYNQTYRKF